MPEVITANNASSFTLIRKAKDSLPCVDWFSRYETPF
jgi:hypothetical protein